MAEPVQRQSLTEKIYQHMKARLAGRQLEVGERINARQIAADLDVSRSTVNKVIDRLILDGWVKTNASRHPVVVALPPRLAVLEPSDFEFANQTDSAYEVLLERILRGDYGPGEIVKERRLAMEIGVNPATIRRAAEWIQKDGLLERLPRRGWRVTLLGPRDLKDSYQIRLLLEPLALTSAIDRITDEEIQELSEQTERLIALGELATVYDRREADYKFHRVLSAAAGNRILAETLEPLIRKVMLITTVGFRYGRASRSFEEHRDILKAIHQRDAKSALHKLKAHLRNAMRFNAGIWERS